MSLRNLGIATVDMLRAFNLDTASQAIGFPYSDH
jgi:hypothetical protein